MATKAWGIKPKNEAQKIALTYLTDATIDLVVLQGVAGSGKTLLALASGLEQVVEQKQYKDIIFTRAPIGWRRYGILAR
jgi:PhoH-like ATPase